MNARLFATLTLLVAPAAFADSVSMNFQGSLGDALKKIADKGHVNLVLTTPLPQPVELYLKDVSAEDALQSVASTYHLKLEKHGQVWAVHSAGGMHMHSMVPAVPAVPAVPGVPPVPPPPVLAGSNDDSDSSDVTEATEASDASDADAQEDKDDDKADEQSEAEESKDDDDEDAKDYVVTGGGTIEENQKVKDTVSYGGTLDVKGDVEGDAQVMGGSLDVHGHVHGDAAAMGGNVHVYRGGTIDGDASAMGGAVIKDKGAHIGGSIVHLGGHSGRWPTLHINRHGEAPDESSGFFSHVPGFLITFALFFALGFLSMIFAPSRMKQIEMEIKADPFRCGVTGFLGLIALTALAVLLTITIIGSPFAAFLLFAAALGVVMGLCAIASELGLKLPFFKGKKTQALVLAVGLFLMMLIGEIPVVGPVLWSVMGLVSFGAIIRTRFGGGRRQGIPERIEMPIGA